MSRENNSLDILLLQFSRGRLLLVHQGCHITFFGDKKMSASAHPEGDRHGVISWNFIGVERRAGLQSRLTFLFT